MLRELAGAGGRVHYNVGNHDHQLYHSRTARVLRAELERFGVPLADGQLTVARWYLDERCGLYAEHGEQFAESESRSPLHDMDGTEVREVAGFYFLRFVWNRLEHGGYGYLQHPNMKEILRVVASIVLERQGPVHRFLDYLGDYFRGKREKDFPLVDSWFIRKLYDRWKARQKRGVRATGVTEADLDAVRDSYEPDPRGATRGSPELLIEQLAVQPPVAWLPGIPVTPQPARVDDFCKGLRTRYDAAAPPFPRLDAARVRIVTVGHTHSERQLRLSGEADVVYFNSGSWTIGNRPAYVWAHSDGRVVTSGMRRF
jgi:hypothetical protein